METLFGALLGSVSVSGKDEISKAFQGRNYGVGCPGGVEVVAHSLRDTLYKFKDSKLGLLKITSGTLSTRSSAATS